MLADTLAQIPYGIRRAEMLERRATSRIQVPVWARIRGTGERRGWEVSTVVDNIGAGGFYVRLLDSVEDGARLFAVIQFTPGATSDPGKLRLAVRGSVVRVESLPGGAHGVAVRILNHKFI